MFRNALSLTMFSLAACAPKPSVPAASGAAEAPAESIAGANIPAGEASKAFAQKLVKFEAKDFRPTDAPGARFTYRTIDFRGDNTWVAIAQMEAAGETLDCKEAGTWAMDSTDDEHTATMSWKLDKTSCAGRPSENTLRVKVNIEKGEYRIVFR